MVRGPVHGPLTVTDVSGPNNSSVASSMSCSRTATRSKTTNFDPHPYSTENC